MSQPKKKPAGKAKDPIRDTLNLPQTDFSMKAGLLDLEPRLQERWQRLGLYERMRGGEHVRGKFLLHDGPPYANGDIHLGHLLNKVLKDVVVRSKIMGGEDVDFVPGWDCHGLPIEHQVLKKLGKKAQGLSTAEIRKQCEAYARKFQALQAEQMQRLGTVGHYQDPYLTMSRRYEAATLRVFADLVQEGLVYRDLKPVHWSITNRTALADAELEYYDRDDISVYVLFEVASGADVKSLFSRASGSDLHLAIWTTTPWTLPANLAVAVSPRETYGLYSIQHQGRSCQVILGVALAEKVLKAAGIENFECLGECGGQALVDAKLEYKHPFCPRQGPVLAADYVTMEDGTGLVHTAPGHGEEDYRTGLREGLDIYCPVQGDGTFDNTVPDWLQGQHVWKANEQITEHLKTSGHLLYSHVFNHSYPHDWRSKTPTIFRATEQWFIGVDSVGKSLGKSLRQRAQEAVDGEVKFVPEWGSSRLGGMLESRPDWCISRQRSWGLPIVAFLAEGKESLLTAASVRAVADVVAEKGAGYWFEASVEECLGAYDPSQDAEAPAWLREAGREGLKDLEKSRDIFDVWFESGSSWNAVLRERGMGYPADLYLEGSDQHRGWFQLSLLPALGATGEAPFRQVLTHGFIVDAQGRKMSKSLGNSIEVKKLLGKHGADICRWWVCSLNYVNDAKADWNFFKTASDEYRKIRNTLRFMLGNLADFDVATHGVELEAGDATSLDAWAITELNKVIAEARLGYDTFHYRKIRDAVFHFCNETLSAVYFAAIKDCLYCEAPNSPKRRRAQKVLYVLADRLLRLLAPVLVHTTEEAYLKLHGLGEDSDESVHFLPLPEEVVLPFEVDREAWQEVMGLRREVQKDMEGWKGNDGPGNPMDVGCVLGMEAEAAGRLGTYQEALRHLCGVSRMQIDGEREAGTIELSDLSHEPRCERSWLRDGTVAMTAFGRLLSQRDRDVLDEIGYEPQENA